MKKEYLQRFKVTLNKMFINYEEVKSNFAVELSGRHQPEQVIDINCIGINQNHVVSDRIQ